MEAGKLDRFITVQRKSVTVSATGAITETWANLMAVRAAMLEMTADEIVGDFGEAEAKTVVFLVRWHPSPITTGDRILCEGATYDLKEIVEVGRRKGWKLRGVAQ
ncbi:phage head closure protein [Rhodobacter sp. KR11]|uniref:phage head closure protein n=1 Tax=Rhodobacter sp. KR11 TaxID=2974588 RepID=UPI002222AC6B|nr:phage head closure protein [Rhodobacter sp. KR11]MCW1919967.1 phage head closure protein [Rhodobacter sp. KR11]